jgi:hypothetical protein
MISTRHRDPSVTAEGWSSGGSGSDQATGHHQGKIIIDGYG